VRRVQRCVRDFLIVHLDTKAHGKAMASSKLK
jgi:hypothetical protein